MNKCISSSFKRGLGIERVAECLMFQKLQIKKMSLKMNMVKSEEIYRFVTDCLMAVGTPRPPAEQQADLLLAADKCGHRSHGLNRLKRYVLDVKSKRCDPAKVPTILKESAATAWVDGNNALGATVGCFCTDLAFQKAKASGVGWISAKGSNHYGICGYWVNRIANKGMIGMTFANGQPLVAPTRAKKAALGTNPLAIAAPGTEESGNFYLDIATSAVALGKIEMSKRNNQKLAPGWAQGPDGKPTTDPDVALKAKCLMPLGGGEMTGGHKGYGLGAVVDMFSGMLAGSFYGYNVPAWSAAGKDAANLGQTFVAIDHTCFGDDFHCRVSDSILYWRKMEPTDPNRPVLAPGDMEKKAMAEAEKTGVINYTLPLLNSYDQLAKELNVKPIQRQG